MQKSESTRLETRILICLIVVLLLSVKTAVHATTFGELGVVSVEADGCNNGDIEFYAIGQLVGLEGRGYEPGSVVVFLFQNSGVPAVQFSSIESDSTGSFHNPTVLPLQSPVKSFGLIEAIGTGSDGDSRVLSRVVQLGESYASDRDSDGRPDLCDLCPDDASTIDPDSDGDGIGDACDLFPDDRDNDTDGDGLASHLDDCPYDAGPDEDGDGICRSIDNCPHVMNADQTDSDHDGVGDACFNDLYASAGIDKTVYSGARVSLNAGRSRPRPLTFRWYQAFGPTVSLSTTTAEVVSFDAPVVTAESVAEFGLVVSDGANESEPDFVRVFVQPRLDIELDTDDDGVLDQSDNCPLLFNDDQQDSDGDDVGDVCAPISDLSARAKNDKVSLDWTHVPAASGYNVYRRRDFDVTFELIAENIQSDYATYLDSGLTVGVTYSYSVRWLDENLHESADSNLASAQISARTRTR